MLLPLLLPAVLLLSAGCPDTLAPPQYPGFIRMAEKGRKGVALDAAGGTALIHWWDCAIRVEPYATERLSIPLPWCAEIGSTQISTDFHLRLQDA
ncbi:MAG: hypothetical protein ABI333_20340 [bacterium]